MELIYIRFDENPGYENIFYLFNTEKVLYCHNWPWVDVGQRPDPPWPYTRKITKEEFVKYKLLGYI